MSKTKTERTVIRAKLEMVNTSRQQYKPYGYNLLPTNVYVEIEIPPEEVVDTFETEDGQALVLNLDGFTTVLGKLADSLDDLHDAYISKARRAGKVPQY